MINQCRLFLTGLVVANFALAQVPDPTRPPAMVMEQELGGGLAIPAESGVQTVILRPRGKSTAVINGQYVEVGGMFGDKRVLSISESEVVLKGESGREVLKVTPSIEKIPAKKIAVRKPPAKEPAHQ